MQGLAKAWLNQDGTASGAAERDSLNIGGITDNGTGFSTDIIKNITKPYFTTKTQGSGLGLSIVNKIINDHNGSIKFLNTSNGAKVQIILPK